MSEQREPLDLWALVELMGRQRIVGRVSEQSIAGVPMLRVDVPGRDAKTKFTRFYGGSAIYAISPIGEKEAIAMAQNLDVEPVKAWELPALITMGDEDDPPPPDGNNNGGIDDNRA